MRRLARVSQTVGDRSVVRHLLPPSGASPADPPPQPPQRSSVSRLLRRAFLPVGYPDSVRSGYIDYARWYSAGALLNSISGVLATQSLLMSVGVGQATASAASAAVNWILKDGVGQIGNLLFASSLGHRFDIQPKRWNFRSGLLLQASIGLEILTTMHPALFLPLAATANFGKGLSWLCGGASRAAIHLSLAKNLNLGDLTAKATSQAIATSIGGMGFGLLLSQAVINPTSYASLASTHAVLACSQLFCLYQALSSVSLHTLNQDRLSWCVDQYVATGSVPHPSELREADSVLLPSRRRRSEANREIVVGSPLSSVFASDAELDTAVALQSHSNALVHATADHVHVLFHVSATPDDQLRAFLVARLVAGCDEPVVETHEARRDAIGPLTVAGAIQFALEHFEGFQKELRAKEWTTEDVLLEDRPQRVSWAFHAADESKTEALT